ARPTATASEDDHILEYDHEHPARGGPTSLANLHRLCWQHHQMKTAGLLDPTRDPGEGEDPRAPLTTRWTLGDDLRTTTQESTDLLTPRTARLLEHAWEEHQRRAALADTPGKRVIPPGSPPPDLGDPPFCPPRHPPRPTPPREPRLPPDAPRRSSPAAPAPAPRPRAPRARSRARRSRRRGPP